MNGTGGLKFLRHTGPIPGRRRALRNAAAALALAGVAGAGCYEAKPLRLTVVTPTTALDCARTADQVFFDAAYVRVNNVYGPDLFYTPRVIPPAPKTIRQPAGLGWGIGIWLKPSESGGHTCAFELESLSSDLPGGVQRIYSPQRGEDFDRTLKDMADRLTAAFERAPTPG